MLPWNQIRRLRKLDGADIVADYAEMTRRRFSREGVAVVIAARNEEADLPATLLTLAGSTLQLDPYVVVNGTTDATADRAQRMGARVLHSSISFKVAALQCGVSAIAKTSAGGPILFTDADTLVGPTWAATMARACRTSGSPVVTLGNSVFTHGESLAADALRSARKLTSAQLRQRRRLRPRAHGHNMAIEFAGSAAALDGYLAIDPARFIGEEEEIVEGILAAGGQWRATHGLDALVVTRGDRFNVSDLWQLRRDRDFTARATRYIEYAGIKPFVPDDSPSQPQRGAENGPQAVHPSRKHAVSRPTSVKP